jgi:hypothetical protein
MNIPLVPNQNIRIYLGQNGYAKPQCYYGNVMNTTPNSKDPQPTNMTLDVDGMKDPNKDITYIGKATQMDDGTWRCLANVAGALCLVEVNINQKELAKSSAFSCSFCGKLSHECEVLIAGPCVNICESCIEIAQECVDEVRANKKTSSLVDFVKYISTGALCETCKNCIPALSPFVSNGPWWDGVCTEGLSLSAHEKNPNKQCPGYVLAEWRIKQIKFTPPPGEFSGCRCSGCPEREGKGECACCAERRDEEKNPNTDQFGEATTQQPITLREMMKIAATSIAEEMREPRKTSSEIRREGERFYIGDGEEDRAWSMGDEEG